jgi:hypothetical protein
MMAQLELVPVVAPRLIVIVEAALALVGIVGGGDIETALPFARMAKGEVLSPHMISQSVLVGRHVPTVLVRAILA